MQLLLKLSIVLVLCTTLNAQIPFNFVCPGNITVNCNIDYSNLDQFGKSYVDQNGVKVWIKDCKVDYDINDCGIGTITRTWGVQDPYFVWQTCTQIITLDNANAFGQKDITWPRDITIESCDPESELKNLGKPFDRPYWKSNKCAKPMLNYSDSRFKVNEGCIKLLRTWRILDWCVYDAFNNPNAGIFTYTQVIKLIKVDSSARINCPSDTVVTTYDCNGVNLKLDPAKVSTVCSMPYVITNDSKYADTSLGDASGYYPIGDHKFYYIGEYACGKEIKCEQKITIENIKQPTPYCKVGVIVDLMPIDINGDGAPDEGMIEVWASDLDHGSFHSCPKRKLTWSFSPDMNNKSKIFTCKELGDNEVTIYVTDEFGNQDHCKTTVVIQNNTGIPNCQKGNVKDKKYNFSFQVINQENQLAPQSSKIILKNTNDNTSVNLNEIGKGSFEIADLNCNEEYQLSFQITDQYKSALSDATWLRTYIQGNINNADPYQILSADLNSDKVINHKDLDLLNFKRKTNQSNGYKIVPEENLYTKENILDEYSKQKLTIKKDFEGSYSKRYLIIPNGRFQSQKNFNATSTDYLMRKENYYSFGLEIFNSYGSLSIRNSNVAKIEVRILDLLGRLMKKITLDSYQTIDIDLENSKMHSGIYIIESEEGREKIFLR